MFEEVAAEESRGRLGPRGGKAAETCDGSGKNWGTSPAGLAPGLGECEDLWKKINFLLFWLTIYILTVAD